MNLDFRFGIISDLHIAVPETINNHAHRFHLVEVSIPALEQALEHLATLEIDFLLLPGDLTQDGEPENHQWLSSRLKQLPFPVYVIPGNHDVPTLLATNNSIGFNDFPSYYQACGYQNCSELYYTKEILPGVQLIALNSNQFDAEGQQIGYLDQKQLSWLQNTLQQVSERLILVMIHHNVIEHLPGQSQHSLGKRYMLSNAPDLLKILSKYSVKLLFTGHLHIQDVASFKDSYEICTGSLVSYPHPYRVVQIQKRDSLHLQIESHRIKSVAGWDNLPQISREWLGDRSHPFMIKLLTSPPLNLSLLEAKEYVEQLRYFWADIAQGDTCFDFPNFPPILRNYFQQYSAISSDQQPRLIDNQANLIISI
ncbi:metallophosphoesterase [Stanieria cyanosphaera PCC 7437]|uniref:Metallophosphoesterase n=1 Tax=Stanieria cyanosphaera (strain ATCC 29371 / PCC 7437) TaxID=111780 RepID=K9XSB7_STAC7|nr:metallophosphoesterase [Stanieria cyanosphaera]AFZ34979.1 metallophosphoesterase [Stanieria cyanosphaera PCC 7437]